VLSLAKAFTKNNQDNKDSTIKSTSFDKKMFSKEMSKPKESKMEMKDKSALLKPKKFLDFPEFHSKENSIQDRDKTIKPLKSFSQREIKSKLENSIENSPLESRRFVLQQVKTDISLDMKNDLEAFLNEDDFVPSSSITSGSFLPSKYVRPPEKEKISQTLPPIRESKNNTKSVSQVSIGQNAAKKERAVKEQQLELDFSYGNELGDLNQLLKINAETLEKLSLNNNNLETLPQHLGKLKKLKLLNISYNKISNIDMIEDIGSLERLDCSFNLLKTIPLSIRNCRSIKSLNFFNNEIGTVCDLNQLKNLVSLDLG
jgi:Leucine-rich repeat (LRR) protein